MGIDQKLGESLPKDAEFTDETGKQVRFGEMFNGRPILLLPIFYQCKGTCDVQLHALLKALVKMKITYPVGAKFDVVMLGIHPRETWDLAKAKKAEILSVYDLAESTGSWHFLTGTEENILKVTDALGFRYVFDPKLNQVNHPAGSMVLTPDGRVSGYFYGAEFFTKPLEQKLDLAAQNKIGTVEKDIILLGCIRMDPVTGQRTLMIENFLKLAGISTVLILVAWITTMSLKYRVTKVSDPNANPTVTNS